MLQLVVHKEEAAGNAEEDSSRIFDQMVALPKAFPVCSNTCQLLLERRYTQRQWQSGILANFNFKASSMPGSTTTLNHFQWVQTTPDALTTTNNSKAISQTRLRPIPQTRLRPNLRS